jgi:Fur family transcriptional regulator, stress-responsive regulator
MTAIAADTELVARLRERGLRVTPQRLLIHRTLRELDRHVTAEELLAAVSERLPNASLPTVYATLELFEELGVVRRVAVGAGPVLWDPRPEPHQHFACRRCGRVLDLDVRVRPTAAIDAARAAGHAPDGAQVLVVGLCDSCAGGRRSG